MTRKTGQLCNCGVWRIIWLTSLETLRLGHAEHTNPRDNKKYHKSFSDQFPSQWLWLNVSNTSVWHVFTNLKFRVTVELNLPFKPVGTLVCCEWQFLDGKTYDWLLVDVECTYVKSFHVDKQIQLIKVRREKKGIKLPVTWMFTHLLCHFGVLILRQHRLCLWSWNS